MAKQMGAMYVECSSKEMSGVHEVFELAVDTAIGREIASKEQRQKYEQFNSTAGDMVVGKTKKSKRRGLCTIL